MITLFVSVHLALFDLDLVSGLSMNDLERPAVLLIFDGLRVYI